MTWFTLEKKSQWHSEHQLFAAHALEWTLLFVVWPMSYRAIVHGRYSSFDGIVPRINRWHPKEDAVCWHLSHKFRPTILWSTTQFSFQTSFNFSVQSFFSQWNPRISRLQKSQKIIYKKYKTKKLKISSMRSYSRDHNLTFESLAVQTSFPLLSSIKWCILSWKKRIFNGM